MKSSISKTALVLIAASYLLIACSKHAVPQGAAPKVEFKTLNQAAPIALENVNKPLLVNFWSTTCGICLKEMPELAELYEKNQSAGFEMIAVAMPYDRPSDVLQLAEAASWPFLVALDIEGEVKAAFDPIPGTPTSFLIDANGQFVDKFIGAVDLGKLQKRLNALHAS